MRFGTDGEGNVGYFGDDDVLIPFSSKINLIETIDVRPLNSYKTYDLAIPLSKINGLLLFRNSTNGIGALFFKPISETKWFSGYGSSLHNLNAFDGGNVFKFNITETQFQFYSAGNADTTYKVCYF